MRALRAKASATTEGKQGGNLICDAYTSCRSLSYHGGQARTEFGW